MSDSKQQPSRKGFMSKVLAMAGIMSAAAQSNQAAPPPQTKPGEMIEEVLVPVPTHAVSQGKRMSPKNWKKRQARVRMQKQSRRINRAA